MKNTESDDSTHLAVLVSVIQPVRQICKAHVHMLHVSQVQLDHMANESFMRRLREFIVERTNDPAMRQAAAAQGDCYTLWRPFMPVLQGCTEREMAIRLGYALACTVRGADPSSALGQSEAQMKDTLEVWGVLRYSEFDI